MKNNAAGAKSASRQVVINLTPAQYDAIAPLTVEFRASIGELMATAGLAFLEMETDRTESIGSRDDGCLSIHAAITDFMGRRHVPDIGGGDLNSHGWGIRKGAHNRNPKAIGGAV